MLLVHLPILDDYKDAEISNYWRYWLDSMANKNGWNYIDLIEELRNLEQDFVRDLFIQSNVSGYVASSGHYTEKGHRYIAEILVKKIAENPAIMDLVRAPEVDNDG